MERLTGTAGERRAGDYIVGALKAMGAEPLPATSSYRLPFTFTASVKDAGSTVSLRDMRTGEAQRWSGVTSVQAIGFSDTERVSGSVVFAGYGLSVPESAQVGYDSYAGLDVTDKVVVALRYSPEDAEPEARAGPGAVRHAPLQGAGGSGSRSQGVGHRCRTAIAQCRTDNSDQVR